MITHATLDAFASKLTGTPTTITCEAPSQFPGETLGFTLYTDGVVAPVIYLPKATCRQLERVNDPTPPNTIEVVDYLDGKPADLLDGSNMLVVEHEAMHIALQSTNECDVERAAIANVWQFVRQFHLPAWKARQVLVGARIQDRNTPANYSQGCTS